MARERYIQVATAFKGGGKSYLTFWECAVPYVLGKLNGGRPGKVLIFDINDEYGITKSDKCNVRPATPEHKKITNNRPILVKGISPDDIPAFSASKTAEIRRIRPIFDKDQYDRKGNLVAMKGESMDFDSLRDTLFRILEEYQNGLLILEDLGSLFAANPPIKWVGAITKNRHNNVDIIWHVQSLKMIPPSSWININYVRYHKETTPVREMSKNIIDRNLYYIAEQIVNEKYEKGNPYYYLLVANLKRQIIGDFTRKEFQDAVKRHLLANKKYMNDILNQKTPDGRPRYTFNEALNVKTREFIRQYYGNG